MKGVRVEGRQERRKEKRRGKRQKKKKKIKNEDKGSDANRADDNNHTPNETKGITRQEKDAKADRLTRSTTSFLVCIRHTRDGDHLTHRCIHTHIRTTLHPSFTPFACIVQFPVGHRSLASRLTRDSKRGGCEGKHKN